MSKDIKLATKKWKNFIQDADTPINAELKKLEELKLSMLNPANWFGKKEDDSLYKPYMKYDWMKNAVQNGNAFNYKSRPAIFKAFVDFWHGDDADYLKKLSSLISDSEGKKVIQYIEGDDLESAFQIIKVERWNNLQHYDIEEGINQLYEIENMFSTLSRLHREFRDETMPKFEEVVKRIPAGSGLDKRADGHEHLRILNKLFKHHQDWLKQYEKNLSDYDKLSSSGPTPETMLSELGRMVKNWENPRILASLSSDSLYIPRLDRDGRKRIRPGAYELPVTAGPLTEYGLEQFAEWAGVSL